MRYLLLKWQQFRLNLMLLRVPKEERKQLINEIKLEAALEQYSRSLRRVR
jgi:hypothetical protein